MTGLKQAFLTFIAVACSITIYAQQPSSFNLGEEELSGIDIYDILQDNKQNYWLATDNGLIKYDGYTFKKIPSKNELSNSVFDLQLDYDNNLYCKNLSGQIFQVINDSSKVYFQLPDSLMASEIYYAFNNLNTLTIASNSIFSINKNKDISFLIPKKKSGNRFYQILKLKDSTLITHNTVRNQFIKIKNDTTVITPINSSAIKFPIQGLHFNNQLLYYNKGTGVVLKRKNNSFEVDKNFSIAKNKPNHIRLYTDENYLWVAELAGGIKAYDNEMKPLFNGNTFFKNNIISSFCKDNEGNIILGTFGEGIIVIPNINITDIKILDPDAKITRITSTPKNTIFFGTQDGRIFRKESAQLLEEYKKSSNKHIEVLYFINQSNELLISEKNPVLINLSTGKKTKTALGAIKDFKQISKKDYLISANTGVYSFTPQKNGEAKIEFLSQFPERTNCVSFNPLTLSIYAGTSQGLKIGTKTNASFFKLKDSQIICRDILYFDEKIFITTKKHGILIFKNDHLEDNWTTENQLISNSVKIIKSYDNKLFLSTNLGIQILDKNGKHLYTLNKSEGLKVNQIIDFEIRNDFLWIVHQKGIQQLNLNKLNVFNFTPSISLTKTLVDDSSFHFTTNTILTHNQNKIEFTVSSNSIKFNSEIKYFYKLEGLDNSWQVNDYTNNLITYKSLPPNDYIFKIKAVCRNNESNTIFIPFKLSPPFWNTWWFYILIALVFLTATYYIFQFQIKKQKKKIRLENELNASKLIAIQSQMNPHFIFNAINSIQDLILKGDIDNSYNYIIKFSKLVRQTLNFSDKEFIDIEDEIDLLTIYLELEKLRFKADFEYSIICDIEDIKVPPMLVQPFVENALKHGLLHKDGLKKLNITFTKNETLNCTVTDNGIGRKKAQEIKSRQQQNHQSFSVNATKSRFKIMQSHYQQDLGVDFEDLQEGTKVIINIPFKQKF
ncbi:histidine kinase [Vicingaceae bacterium]|nr:histidine kinase [Vicingaceae bacterium]